MGTDVGDQVSDGHASASDDLYDFDVALSFAGEDRDYVEEVAAGLKAAGVRVFLDSDFLSDQWGEDLVEFFDGIYRLRSRFAILFISRHYAEKMWPRLERRSALARAVSERGAYVLPVRLDDSNLEGLRPTVGVQAFGQKLSGRESLGDTAVTRAPRNTEEMQWVIDARPPGWEYLYFAGCLLNELERLAPKYRDHLLRYAAANGQYLREEELPAFIAQAASTASSLSDGLMRVMDLQAQERAFGAPGEPGSPDEIQHLAERWTSTYEGFLDWASSVRSTVVSEEYRPLLDRLARLVDEPIDQYRDFVARFVASVDKIPEHLANADATSPLTIEMTLTISIPDDTLNDYRQEYARVFGE
jgi:hypothetical protein